MDDYYCRKSLASLLTRTLLPESITEQLRVQVNGTTQAFHPLPFGHDSVMLIGRRAGSNLTVVFYDTANGMFLPAIVTLTYAQRCDFVKRRRQFVKELVRGARREYALATA